MLGFGLRLALIHQTLFGDELATYWDVTTHSMAGVLKTVHSDAEITPPLYFVLAKLATYISVTPEMLRLPSLIAGTATIPMTYFLGVRTVGRRAGLAAAALVTLSPFLIYYSTEARGYQLMIGLLLASTLALLRGVEGGGLRWWVAYAAFSCAAMYTHYTVAFALAAQAIWALWAHPGARRALLLANLGAALAFLPWSSGFIADLKSSTTDILSLLQPFSVDGVRISLEHWSIGYAYAKLPLSELPGYFAIILIGAGIALSSGAFLVVRARSGATVSPRIDDGLLLILALGLATPICAAAVSAVSTNLFGTRNLAAAWPGCALLLGALVARAPGRWVRACSTTFVLIGFGIGAWKMLGDDAKRPDFDGPARIISARAAGSDVVLEQVYGPGPLSPLDTTLGHSIPIVRVGVPPEQDHPFTVFDSVAGPDQIEMDILAASRGGGRVFAVGSPGAPDWQLVMEVLDRLRPPYRVTKRSSFGGLYPVKLLVLSPRKNATTGTGRG